MDEVKETSILESIIARLEGISVPVALAQQITVPLLEVSSMLKQLYNMKAETAEKEKELAVKTEAKEAERFDY